jgi:hypothetical protein
MPPPCKLNIEDQFDKGGKEVDVPDIILKVKETLDSPLTSIMKEPLTVLRRRLLNFLTLHLFRWCTSYIFSLIIM